VKSAINLIKEFKPALQFLGVFIVCYVAMSLVYGLYIESYGEKIDPWTKTVAQQVAMLVTTTDESVVILDSYHARSCSLANSGGEVLSVFEGCNGLNVIILFLSFLIAYRGPVKKFIIFAIVGVIIIHVVNLGRVAMLYYVANSFPHFMYFTHKYLFTAIIYAVVFGLWYLWATKYNANPILSKTSGHS